MSNGNKVNMEKYARAASVSLLVVGYVALAVAVAAAVVALWAGFSVDAWVYGPVVVSESWQSAVVGVGLAVGYLAWGLLVFGFSQLGAAKAEELLVHGKGNGGSDKPSVGNKD
jgi:hypothetical protein